MLQQQAQEKEDAWVAEWMMKELVEREQVMVEKWMELVVMEKRE
jgi:hypothetical protein